MTRSGTVSTANIEASLDRTKRRVTQMLLTVVICFLVCWAPFVIYNAFIERFVAPFPNPADPIRVITYGFGLFNSVCNPFIYFFNSPNFRRDSLRRMCLQVRSASGHIRETLNYTASTKSSFVGSRSDTVSRFKNVNGIEKQIGKDNDICEPETYDTRL